MVDLVEQQVAALKYVRERAASRRPVARRRAASVLNSSYAELELFDEALTEIKRYAPIDVSFHPDRLDLEGQTVVGELLKSGRYRNQFETGISNGGITAFEGGERDAWERNLFGGAYQQRGTVPSDRPKYGALNLLGHWDGACPRFGSCYFRLKTAVAQRCTFTFGDSWTAPDDHGVIKAFDSVLAAVLETILTTGGALGVRDLQVRKFLEQLANPACSGSMGDFDGPPGRVLDEIIEVHIHGPVRLRHDVECLVADGSFRTTKTGKQLAALGDKHDFSLFWTPGLFLPVDDVPSDFRGAIMVHWLDTSRMMVCTKQ